MKVLFAVAEADPFAKTGGLGDVGGSLPVVLNRLDCSMGVIMPLYRSIPLSIKEEMRHLVSFTVELGWRRQYCGLNEIIHQGVLFYFIENEYYFDRDQLYGYGDDGERFAFFSRAVLESLLYIEDFKPDVIHCNDWHTALIPVMLREYYSGSYFYKGIKTLLTIHNLRYQGVFPKEILEDLLSMDEKSPGAGSLEFYGGVNYFKGGLLTADAITTVSPTYAKEILDADYGEGLEEILKRRKENLTGILNGINNENYNPGEDQALTAHYPSPGWKKENKLQLQAKLNLPVNGDVPLVAVVSRLTGQKGFDILLPIMEEVVKLDVQIVVLGTGEEKYEAMFRSLARRYPERLAAVMVFDDELARKIYGGGNILLMPSRFEPCGLAQMMAMGYGTIPLVRETGGLKDSVIPYNPATGIGNGFTFSSYNSQDLLTTLERAVKLFREDKEAWGRLENNALETDFSWEKSARKYIDLYRDILI